MELDLEQHFDKYSLVDHIKALKEKQQKLNAQFDKFEKETALILKEAKKQIEVPMSGNLELLEKHLDTLIPLSLTTGETLIRASNWLILFEVLYYAPKSKELPNDFDRKLQITINTLKQNTLVSKLKNVNKKIDNKISVAQSMLKSEVSKTFRE
jgi:hypothetical protein